MTFMTLAVMPLIVCGAMMLVGATLDTVQAWHDAAFRKRDQRGKRPAAP